MGDWKKICKKLLFLPVWLICVLVVVSTVALVAVFVNNLSMHPIAYIVYVASAYALAGHQKRKYTIIRLAIDI